MAGRGRGAIINLASTAAFQPMPGNATYAATKAFVLSLGEATHAELSGAGVTVTAVCPGPVKTEFADVAGIGDSEERVPGFVWTAGRGRRQGGGRGRRARAARAWSQGCSTAPGRSPASTRRGRSPCPWRSGSGAGRSDRRVLEVSRARAPWRGARHRVRPASRRARAARETSATSGAPSTVTTRSIAKRTRSRAPLRVAAGRRAASRPKFARKVSPLSSVCHIQRLGAARKGAALALERVAICRASSSRLAGVWMSRPRGELDRGPALDADRGLEAARGSGSRSAAVRVAGRQTAVHSASRSISRRCSSATPQLSQRSSTRSRSPTRAGADARPSVTRAGAGAIQACSALPQSGQEPVSLAALRCHGRRIVLARISLAHAAERDHDRGRGHRAGRRATCSRSPS